MSTADKVNVAVGALSVLGIATAVFIVRRFR